MPKEPNKPSPNRPPTKEESSFSEILGVLVEQWGFNRHLGRIWSTLYLSPEPVSATFLQESLALSAGAISASLAELQNWGVIKRSRLPGDRNIYFEAETEIWKSISNVLRARELRILEEAQNQMQVLAENLKNSAGRDERNSFQAKRVKHVRDAIETAHTLFTGLITPQSTSVAKLSALYKKLKSL